MLAALVLSATAVPAVRDKHEMCESWAENGECSNNPPYMNQECPRSCAGAGRSADGRSSQVRKECEGYAQMGECSRNPAFMLSTCRKECDAWEVAKGVRIDRSPSCVEWSLLGKSARTTWSTWRASATRRAPWRSAAARSTFSGWSVGICDKALRCEVEDKKSNCASLAARGKCRDDATHMAQNCLSTCAEQDVDGVLSAQRAEFRAILSPLIDIPGSMSRRHERCWLPGWSGQRRR